MSLFRSRVKPSVGTAPKTQPFRFIASVNWNLRLVVVCALTYGYGVFVCSRLSAWPWLAAAYAGPLWAVVGAAYATHSEASRAQATAADGEATATTTALPSPKVKD